MHARPAPPAGADRYFGKVLRGAAKGTRLARTPRQRRRPLVGDPLDPRPQRLDRPRRERPCAEPPQPRVRLAVLRQRVERRWAPGGVTPNRASVSTRVTASNDVTSHARRRSGADTSATGGSPVYAAGGISGSRRSNGNASITNLLVWRRRDR
ncbi:hypothetical protein BJF79_48915 [Actinomadura sp. CNU-125]|uniref:hypothetical protein n=1 Tax=Actinomadura sp. CNU-125 TaxID=1904961 RepID=UPI000967F624|nr:hypothetical protein [Actinomadura sp. CNU-125]OLT14908.1 hypothetical protein BJF79_48915 [Actinomadura sp. CNU-125]